MALELTRPDGSPLVGSPLTVTGATNATPIVITTSTAHGYATGDGVRIAGVAGNTAANGDWAITVLTSTTFSLTGSAGSAAYTSGGTSTRIPLFRVERGVPSAVQAVKIKNTGVVAVSGAHVTLSAEQPPGGGVYVGMGNPIVDERMGRFKITSVDSSGTAGQTAEIGDEQILGANAVTLLPSILPGNSIFADFWLSQGSSSTNAGAGDVRIEIANVSAALPLPLGVSEVATGVLTEIGTSYKLLISGRGTTATGTPDDQVHTAAGSWIIGGASYTDASIRDTALNQNDSAASALTAGQSYYAALTQGTANAPTATKGLRASAPTKPTLPSGEVLLAWVRIYYQAGGTSVIATADIENVNNYGRLLVTAPATGLSVTVYPGRAISSDFMLIHGISEVLSLTASATNYIWIEITGAVTKTTTSTPPSAGALLLASAVTNASAVTTLTDLRTFIAGAGATPAAHASAHNSAGSDPLSVAGIGAAAASHTHAQADVTGLVADLAAKATKIYEYHQEFTYPAAVTVSKPIASGTAPAVYRNGQLTLLSEWTRTGQAFTVTPYAADDIITVRYWSTTP